jgi:hypothetical protein
MPAGVPVIIGAPFPAPLASVVSDTNNLCELALIKTVKRAERLLVITPAVIEKSDEIPPAGTVTVAGPVSCVLLVNN